MPDELLKPLEEKTLYEKLYLDKFKVDTKTHLIVNQDACRRCEDRVCLMICPAEVYKWEEAKGGVTVSYEGCLECGTCRIACSSDAIDWRNPGGGFGVSYRFG